MSSTDPAVAIVSADLGTAATFDPHIFPLGYYTAGDDFSKGSFLIKATLDEMKAIKQLGIDLNKNEDFIFSTRIKLEALKVKRDKLQDNTKTLNPFKAFLNYRAIRLFHAASKALYVQTKSTSERIQRDEDVQVVPTTQMRTVDGAIPPGAKLVGYAVELPDGWNENAKQTINDARETITKTDPFQDNSIISQLGDDEHAITLADAESLLSQDVCDSGADEGNQTSGVSSDLQRSRPTSPQINHIHIYQNSIVTTNSNLTGLTYNRGSRNSGASVTQQFAP